MFFLGMSLSDPGILSAHTHVDDFLENVPTATSSPKKSRGSEGISLGLSSSAHAVPSEKSPKRTSGKKTNNIFEKNSTSSNGSEKLGSSSHSAGSSDIIGGVDF